MDADAVTIAAGESPGAAPLPAAGGAGASAGLYRRVFGRLMLQTLICVVPSSILLGIGHATQAGVLFWGLFCILYVRLLFLGRPLELLCL
ncbi:MAG TPA: hypothetical protein VMM80_03740, partial [Bacteroidota bacterium]|nr:hypothetical protein [Bacteroidota bacterium]